MSDKPFDMPDATHSFEERGRWLAEHFTLDLGLGEIWRGGGITGNLGYESGGLKIMQEVHPVSGRGGYGWEQATGPRRRAFEAYGANLHEDIAGDQANYGFILMELRGSYAYVVRKLMAATTLEEAVLAFGIYDEAPAGTTPDFLPGYNGRLAYALRAMSGTVGPSGSTPVPADAIEGILSYPDFAAGVTAYQQSRGLTADGQIGPITLRRIWSDMTNQAGRGT